jgi:hypothetical protein
VAERSKTRVTPSLRLTVSRPEIQCNAPRSFPPTFSRCFPAGFSDSRCLRRARRPVRTCRWDRILACVGADRYPSVRRSKPQRGAPGKSSRAIFAFCSPRPPLGSFTKENGGFWVNALRENGFDSGERSKKLLVGMTPPAQRRHAGGLSRFSSEPTPSHRPWASARARPLADLDASKPD